MTRCKRTLSQNDARTYLRLGVTPRGLVRLRWPDMTDDDADFMLWEQTPFPLVSGVHDVADAVAAIEAPK